MSAIFSNRIFNICNSNALVWVPVVAFEITLPKHFLSIVVYDRIFWVSLGNLKMMEI